MDPRDLNRALVRFALAMMFAAVPAVAGATVNAVAVLPDAPTTCDPVTLTAQGTFGGCDSIVSREVSGPEEIPDWVGPLPAYRTRIDITVLREDSVGCPAILKFYAEDFPMGPMPFGQHMVTATERVVDPDGALLDSSVAHATFTVTQRDSCDTTPCILLSFVSPWPQDDLACDGAAMPGGNGSFRVALYNTVPVGGVQLRIQITGDGQTLPEGWFVPQFISTTTRSSGMEIAWEADGSAANVMLFSSTGATIPPGHEPILRVVYGVASNVPADVYEIRFEQQLVADAEGNELFPCPTFRQSLGRFCVGPTQGCDLDGDGMADIRDIIRLVRCALAGDACPDSIAAASDCNGDDAVDVRDVICCVRKLLAVPPQGAPLPALPGEETALRIGFAGNATWTTPLSGRADIAIEPGTDFGGVQFEVVPSTGARVTSIRVSGSAYRLDWANDSEGRARAVLLRIGPTIDLALPRVMVDFERIGAGIPGGGELRLENIRTVTNDAAYARFTVTAGAALIPGAPVAAPMIYAARPSPFAGSTQIPFTLPAPARVSIRVYDVAGRLVRTLVDGEQPAGAGRATWDGKDGSGRALPAGIYFAKLNAAGVERTSRIMKLR